jgi:hypothetical protein
MIGFGLRIVYSENVLFPETSSAINLDRKLEIGIHEVPHETAKSAFALLAALRDHLRAGDVTQDSD